MKEKRIRKNKYGVLQLVLKPHRITRLLKRFPQQELADIFEVNEKTIRRLKNPSNRPKQKVGRKQKIKGWDLDIFRSYVISSTWTQKFMAWVFSWLLYGCNGVSQSTVCRTMKRLGIIYKKITYQATEQLRKENQEKIKHFINVTLPHLLKIRANIFFLDECGFHLNEAPRKGYHWKGSRLFKQKSGNKGENQTLILLAQITNGEKIIHWKTIEGGVNGEKFHQFLSNFNPPNNGKKNVLIIDNLPAHRATDSCRDKGLSTIEELARSKGIEIIFLPPYTPELNPIEEIFNIIRKYIEKNQAKEKERLDLAIEEKLKFFQGENLNKYLESSVKECLAKNREIQLHNLLASGEWVLIKGAEYDYLFNPNALDSFYEKFMITDVSNL